MKLKLKNRNRRWINNVMKIGKEYPIRIEVDLKGLNCNEVGMELAGY
jgi:RNase P subunit RPR2